MMIMSCDEAGNPPEATTFSFSFHRVISLLPALRNRDSIWLQVT